MIELYADHYFHIGRMHLTGGKPCQDYAISGVCDGLAYAAVSDGCSTGGHTDVGARVIALSATYALRQIWVKARIVSSDAMSFSDEMCVLQQTLADAARHQLGLQMEDLLATSVCAYATQNRASVLMQGDGVVAWKWKTGEITMHRYEWERNMPFYPAYAEDNFHSFIHSHGGDGDFPAFTCTSCTWNSQDGVGNIALQRLTVREGIYGAKIAFDVYAMANGVEFLAVFTDGVTQIDGVDWKDAVVQLLSFKTIEGEFAKRRMIRVIKDSEKHGKGPLDDIAYAVIRVAETDEEEGA